MNKLSCMSCLSRPSCQSHHVTQLQAKLLLMFYLLNAEFYFPAYTGVGKQAFCSLL